MRRWAASVLLMAGPTRPLDVGRRDFLATISAATQTQWTPTALPRLSLDQAATFDRLDFARYPDPILRLEAKPARRFDAALAKTVTLLRAAARRHGAQGLAATQCGVDAAIVLLGDEAFVNPTIVARSPEARLRCWTERCLALPPDVRVETLRDEVVVVSASTVAGAPFTTTLTGAAARQFSHEYDHARGVLIIDHAYDTVASTAFPAMARLEEPLHVARRRKAWDRA